MRVSSREQSSTSPVCIYGAAAAADGSVVLVGSSCVNVHDENEHACNIAATKLDADRIVVWQWQVKQAVFRS